MSEDHTHYKNASIIRLIKVLKVQHHVSLTYTPWRIKFNASLESEILQSIKSVGSELHIRPQKWPDQLSVVQILQIIEAFLQCEAMFPVAASIYQQTTAAVSKFTISATVAAVTATDVKLGCMFKIQTLMWNIAELHHVVLDSLCALHKGLQGSSPSKMIPKYSVYDLVLVAQSDSTSI